MIRGRSLTIVVASAAVMRPLWNHTSAAGRQTPTTAAPSTHSGKAEVQRSHLHGVGEAEGRSYVASVRIIAYVSYSILHVRIIRNIRKYAVYTYFKYTGINGLTPRLAIPLAQKKVYCLSTVRFFLQCGAVSKLKSAPNRPEPHHRIIKTQNTHRTAPHRTVGFCK